MQNRVDNHVLEIVRYQLDSLILHVMEMRQDLLIALGEMQPGGVSMMQE